MTKLIVLIDCYQEDLLSLIRIQHDAQIVLVESKTFQYQNLLTRVRPNENEMIIEEAEIQSLLQFASFPKKLIINCTDQSIFLKYQIDMLMSLPTQFKNQKNKTHDKYKILQILFENQLILHQPKLVNTEAEYDLVRPDSNYITKPIWGGGSIGVTINQRPKSFPAIVQNFFIGDEYAFDFCTDNSEHQLCTVWKYIRAHQTDIKKDRIDLVTNMSSPEITLMQNYCKKALDAIGFQNGLAHIEVKINSQLQTELIEINLRFQGHTPYRTLMQLGIPNQFDALVNGQYMHLRDQADFYLTRFILQSKSQNKIKIPWDQIKNLATIKEIHSNYSENSHTFLNTNDSRSYVAYLTLASSNKFELEKDLNYLSSLQALF